MSNLALVYDLKDNDEINKLNEFCRYENISIDYYLVEKQFQKISLISKLNESSKIPYCPIILGTNFLDQVNALEELKEIVEMLQ